MTNAIAICLTIALLIDAASNIGRLIGVWRALKQQGELMKRSELEYEARMEAAEAIVKGIIEAKE
jgi:hypothetical protein